MIIIIIIIYKFLYFFLLQTRGRKKIRKLLDSKKLSNETKSAQQIEKERRERLEKDNDRVSLVVNKMECFH